MRKLLFFTFILWNTILHAQEPNIDHQIWFHLQFNYNYEGAGKKVEQNGHYTLHNDPNFSLGMSYSLFPFRTKNWGFNANLFYRRLRQYSEVFFDRGKFQRVPEWEGTPVQASVSRFQMDKVIFTLGGTFVSQPILPKLKIFAQANIGLEMGNITRLRNFQGERARAINPIVQGNELLYKRTTNAYISYPSGSTFMADFIAGVELNEVWRISVGLTQGFMWNGRTRVEVLDFDGNVADNLLFFDYLQSMNLTVSRKF